jgi:phosphoribosylamine-glycine ligase
LEQQLVTDGGRVLGVTGIGETFEQAIALAYAALNCIHFEGCITGGISVTESKQLLILIVRFYDRSH